MTVDVNVATRGLSAMPGSDSFYELVHLLRDPRKYFLDRFERHGYVWRSRILVPVVFLIGAEANKTIHVTRRSSFSYELGYGATHIRRIFEGSLMLLDGDAQQRARHILSPAVGKLALAESADKVTDIWQGAADDAAASGAGVDVYAMVERATFDVAANVLAGFHLGEETARFRHLFETLIDGVMAPIPLRVPMGRLDRALRARRKLIKLLEPRIAAARERAPEGLVGQLAHHRDEDGSPVSSDEIAAHVLLLVWAGYDTTASAGSWVMHQLARRPDWQDRLRSELSRIVGDRPLTTEDGRKLVEMSWFMREIERMFPSALFFPRVTTEPIHFNGYDIPKGKAVFYSPYLTHRDPALFDNPNAFEPERWDPERPGRKAKSSYLVGFGGGPRVCLGKAFALMQLSIMIASVVRRYRVEPDPKARVSIQGVPVHRPVGSIVTLRPL